MVLLDYPDSEGVTRELVIGYRRRLSERKILFAVGVSALLLLGVGVGVGGTVLRSSATGPAPDVHLPVIPFPSASASSSPSGIVRVHGTHPAPGAKAMRNIASAASPTPSIVSLTPSAVSLTPSAVSLTPSTVSLMPSAVSLTPSAVPVTTSSAAASAQPAIVVRYLVGAQADGGFEGEVHVVNNGSAPISGWQIAVALPEDRITAIGGADGYVSNHILLMQPAPDAAPLAAGGELSVVFMAQGPEMTPQFCAFDDTVCQ
jgi:Cellulose binding domain